MVFIFAAGRRTVLDGSLGFAAGVMLAASYWSLLSPAIELSRDTYGSTHAYFPAAAGFVVGAWFVYGADWAMDRLGFSGNLVAMMAGDPKRWKQQEQEGGFDDNLSDVSLDMELDSAASGGIKHRKSSGGYHGNNRVDDGGNYDITEAEKRLSWRRIVMLIIAITIHNIPEGLAVGVGFGSVGRSASLTYENAVSLAVGVGIQNFPEGLAVSLPLRGAGVSLWRSFFYGQLSGMVEPLAGVFGACMVVVAAPLLPYSLGFAAGAMVFVVVDDIVPEAHTRGNGKFASVMVIVGFVVMMVLDVGLG